MPRSICVIFALFLSLFALDVFTEGYGFWDTLVALFMHLIPTFLVLVALGLAWRWEWVGALLFSALGIAYLVMAWGKFEWFTVLTIAGPMFLVAALFLAGWLQRRQPDGGVAQE